MTAIRRIVALLFWTACYLGTIASEEVPTASGSEEQLASAESKDKLEIVKKIKKVNDDGSYTIGYEADDGSFKIESRDVLGNIKGTYGFVDDEGQVKRVSYSTNNGSEIQNSVVQRIPQKTTSTSSIPSTTRRPSTQSTTPYSTTASTTASSNVIQSIARRRTSSISTSSTTPRPNYQNIINVNSRSTSRPSNTIVYTSAAPRVLLQKPSSTISTTTKSSQEEPTSTTPIPVFRHYSLKRFEDKTVLTEPPEGNILRRQLSHEKVPEFNVLNLRQSIGQDHQDVYNSGVSVTHRPLFTTTPRSSRVIPLISSTTSSPVAVPRPSPPQYQTLEEEENGEYAQESTATTETPLIPTVVQVPPNSRVENDREPLVAVRHPFQRGATILVPLSHLRGRLVPVENRQYVGYERNVVPAQSNQQNVEIEQQQLKKIVPVNMRPIPVQVDDNGYIREVPQRYAIPIPVSQPKYVMESDLDNDIDKIEPPVSTKEFQMLLEQLIMRQKKLERIAALTTRRIQQQESAYRQQQYQPYVLQRAVPTHRNTGPIQFEDNRRYNHNYVQSYEQQEASKPSRRVARLLPNVRENGDQYLPVEVREMLLLRMLQLAMNPALPLDNDDVEDAINNASSNTPSPVYRKAPPVRNIEILGEDSEEEERPRRSLRRGKRIKEDFEDMEYLE